MSDDVIPFNLLNMVVFPTPASPRTINFHSVQNSCFPWRLSWIIWRNICGSFTSLKALPTPRSGLPDIRMDVASRQCRRPQDVSVRWILSSASHQIFLTYWYGRESARAQIDRHNSREKIPSDSRCDGVVERFVMDRKIPRVTCGRQHIAKSLEYNSAKERKNHSQNI